MIYLKYQKLKQEHNIDSYLHKLNYALFTLLEDF